MLMGLFIPKFAIFILCSSMYILSIFHDYIMLSPFYNKQENSQFISMNRLYTQHLLRVNKPQGNNPIQNAHTVFIMQQNSLISKYYCFCLLAGGALSQSARTLLIPT